jgi:hypothetical protein
MLSEAKITASICVSFLSLYHLLLVFPLCRLVVLCRRNERIRIRLIIDAQLFEYERLQLRLLPETLLICDTLSELCLGLHQRAITAKGLERRDTFSLHAHQ